MFSINGRISLFQAPKEMAALDQTEAAIKEATISRAVSG
jgi:hypothetical protein